MSNGDVDNSPTGRAGQLAAFEATLSALAQAGATKFEPVRWHYLQRLAGRAAGQPDAVQQILVTRLAQELAALQARIAQAQGAAPAVALPDPPPATAALADLVHRLTLQSAVRANDALDEKLPTGTGSFPAPGAAQYFRTTWSQLSVNKRVTQALMQAPKNAGPINSHNLVLRSLALMRAISPDYLHQFTSYVDTLLGLEQHEKAKLLPTKPAVAADRRPTPKPRRARPR